MAREGGIRSAAVDDRGDREAKGGPGEPQEELGALEPTAKESLPALPETPPPVTFVPTTRSFFGRELRIIWYRGVAWYRRRALFERLLYMAVLLSLPVQTAVKNGWSLLSIGSIVALVLLHGRKAWMEHDPKHMRQLEKNYLMRKFALAGLIRRRDGRWNAAEVQSFRVDVLKLLASYVRDHRADLNRPKIHANLMVLDGDDIVVIARDSEHRKPNARYPRTALAASKAFETGQAVVVGDVAAEFPDGPKDKRYASIVAYPLYRNDKIVGVLSIDSEVKYHFDWESDSLWDFLQPYIALLSWTLSEKHVRGALGSCEPGGTSQ